LPDVKRAGKPLSPRFTQSNANVLFCLNLSPKAVLNHKAKWVITLAYGLFHEKQRKFIMLRMTAKNRHYYYTLHENWSSTSFSLGKRVSFPEKENSPHEKK